MIETTQAAPFAVVSTSRAAQLRRAASLLTLALGLGYGTLEKILPLLNLPHSLDWLPGAVATVGALVAAWQKTGDAGKIATANYSEPAGIDLGKMQKNEVRAQPDPLPPSLGHAEVIAAEIGTDPLGDDLPRE